MSNDHLKLNITPEWAREQAKLESEGGVISVGGLAVRMKSLTQQTDSEMTRDKQSSRRPLKARKARKAGSDKK